MPIVDPEAAEKSLAKDYGGAAAEDWHDLALVVGDPRFGGVELSGNGYARVRIFKADWATPAGEIVTTTAPVQMASATGPWDEPTHILLIDPGGLRCDTTPLSPNSQWPTAAGPGPLVWPSVYYNRDLEV